MLDSVNLSPAGWALLEMLQQQSGVTLDVVHVWLQPVRQSPVGYGTRLLEEPGVAQEALKAIRTGEVRIDSTRDLVYGIFPLRRTREVIGCLVASHGRTDAEGDTDADAIRAVGDVGALARTALESELALTAQVTAAQALTRRLRGILRFLGEVGTQQSEREVMHAVLHAATVWFDLDCRIYQRQPDGSFHLSGCLPAVDEMAPWVRLQGSRINQLLAMRRFPSGGDLDDLGLAGRRDEVLVLPVGLGEPRWVLLVAGGLESQAELTFSAIARVLTGEFHARAVGAIERWRKILESTNGTVAPERTILQMLEQLAAETQADRGRVTLLHGDEARLLAAFGYPVGEAVDQSPDYASTRSTGLIETTFGIAPNIAIRLELRGAEAQLSQEHDIVQQWWSALQPWFASALNRIIGQTTTFDLLFEAPAFERRIQEEVERAKRFNLGLGLVLIGPSKVDAAAHPTPFESLATVVRPELRASDLLGKIRGGLVAVLLVHSGAEGADSVLARLRQRLVMRREGAREGTAVSAAVQVGKAIFSPDCASADELIAQALRQSQELPLRH
jgi:GGDEF domain-containing protein